ncbi:MAG: hypothetical protein A3H91_02535 [Gammaproteobacteria bacterium RIFCSPLOWO2_02_FULL_61_13]|nr:MAG: hypothetical protein A3H91_02535 [Gammaproteobacteria bacterium RIFCSPLOWO2_02_FULL_61_13]
MKLLQRARRFAKKSSRIGRRFSARIEKRLYRLGLRSSAQLTLPDFLCIGAQKAGTTWLYENLRRHPEIFLPHRKELHYFDWGYSRHINIYAKNFENVSGKIKGDITPAYAVIAPDRIDIIRAIMPDAKILMLLRNPVGRA